MSNGFEYENPFQEDATQGDLSGENMKVSHSHGASDSEMGRAIHAAETTEVSETTETGAVEHQTTGDGTVAERKPKIDASGYAYATGKRKNAIARVWVRPGSSSMVINRSRRPKEYFIRDIILRSVYKPLVITKSENFDVKATVRGGGLTGQAEALMYGIAKALNFYNPNLRPILKKAKLLTRDNRVVERKKYGRSKARKRFQFSKR